MAITKLNPYLNFNGTASKAIAHYERALGARTDHIMRFADAPGMEGRPETKDWVMHAQVHIGDVTFMASDTMPDMPAQPGSNVHVCLNFDDPADLTKKFEALAAGGKITVPVQDTFWGAKFGMLTDAFGVSWMFNCELKKG